MEITSLKHPIPDWRASYAQDFEDGSGNILHGVYLMLADGTSYWILDADSKNQAKEISDLINLLFKTHIK